MKKYMLDMTVADNIRLHTDYYLLKLTPGHALPEINPGQFAQVWIKDAPHTFLRRPVSIHYVDREKNELWLLVRAAGDGTRALSRYKPGDCVNLLLPLGNGFSIPESPKEQRLLLTGGGVGVAPLLYLGERLKALGFQPMFLLGARTKADLLQTDDFGKLGIVYATTEDGSYGEKGVVTGHSILRAMHFDYLYACGPKNMMIAVAKYAAANDIPCEVSLENTMACGIGACLCCVEDTATGGNICVCTEGPVMNIKQLKWLT